MGMFDEIKCQYPLPDNPPDWVKNARFQTKNFDNLLDLYTITLEGRLIRHYVEREYSDDESACLGYKVRIIREWQEPVEFHGDIIFYTSNIKSSTGDQYGLMNDTGDVPLNFEYKARFTEGELQWIRALHKPIAQQIKGG